VQDSKSTYKAFSAATYTTIEQVKFIECSNKCFRYFKVFRCRIFLGYFSSYGSLQIFWKLPKNKNKLITKKKSRPFWFPFLPEIISFSKKSSGKKFAGRKLPVENIEYNFLYCVPLQSRFSITGYLSKKSRKTLKIPSEKLEIEKTGSAVPRCLTSCIMAQNVNKIVCSSSELSRWCKVSKKVDLYFFTILQVSCTFSNL
jgi:hypothetical protein